MPANLRKLNTQSTVWTASLALAVATIMALAAVVPGGGAVAAAVQEGQVIDVRVQLQAGNQPVSGVQVFLDFDPASLEVVDADPQREGVQVQEGSAFPIALSNLADNDTGQIDFTAGQLGGPFPSGDILVATIQFRVKNADQFDGKVTFSTEFPRDTFADSFGSPLSAELQDAMLPETATLIIKINEMTLRIHPPTAGRSPGSEVTVSIIAEGENVARMAGLQLEMKFDPAVVKVVDDPSTPDSVEGIGKGDDLPSGFHFVAGVDNAAGIASVIAGRATAVGGSVTSMTVADVTFKLVGAGGASTQLTLDRILIADEQSRLLASRTEDGAITIELVDISLEPQQAVVDTGQTFTMDVVVDAGEQPVSGVQAFLDFDPARLQVQDADGNPDNGVQVQAGSTLPTILFNLADNEAGQIGYAAGQELGGSPASGTIVLATITFRAVEATPGTDITFSTQRFRESVADFGGNPLPGALTGATVAIRVGLFAEPVDDDMTDQFIRVQAGQAFDVDIKVAAGDQPVAGVQAFLDFDPGLLQVLDADPARPGVQARPGSALVDFMDLNLADNELGQIDFAAGNLLPPGGSGFPTGAFVLATVRFRALTSTEGTLVGFSTSPVTRETLVSAPGGEDVTGSLHDGTVEIMPRATLRVSFRFQGGARIKPDGWQQPVTVELEARVGGESQSVSAISQFDAARQQAFVDVPMVHFGAYDLFLTGPSTLSNVNRDVPVDVASIDADLGVVAVDLGTLISGNANGDGTRGGNQIINILDFGILAGAFGATQGEPRFDSRADFDANRVVNVSDFGLLSRNFLAVGPVEVVS